MRSVDYGGSLSVPTVMVEIVDEGSHSCGSHCTGALNLSLDARHRTVLEISGAICLAAVVGLGNHPLKHANDE